MKLKIILSVFAALAFMSGFSAENPDYKPTRVDFTSNPEGALVTVDGEDKGHTPVTLFDLAPGVHRIKFSKKDWEADEKFLKISPDGGYLMCSGSLTLGDEYSCWRRYLAEFAQPRRDTEADYEFIMR